MGRQGGIERASRPSARAGTQGGVPCKQTRAPHLPQTAAAAIKARRWTLWCAAAPTLLSAIS